MIFGSIECTKCGASMGINAGIIKCYNCERISAKEKRDIWIEDRENISILERLREVEQFMYDHKLIDHTNYNGKLK